MDSLSYGDVWGTTVFDPFNIQPCEKPNTGTRSINANHRSAVTTTKSSPSPTSVMMAPTDSKKSKSNKQKQYDTKEKSHRLFSACGILFIRLSNPTNLQQDHGTCSSRKSNYEEMNGNHEPIFSY